LAREKPSSPFDVSVEDALRTIRANNAEYKALLYVVDDPKIDPSGADPSAPLRGVPYVLKDTWEVRGLPTTGGSWRHRARISTRSSRVHEALAKSGAVLLGKSSCGDLAFSPECANHILGAAKNPFDPTRTSGGSTGGGAVAVALGMAAFDWGGDFGGSIRMPAGFCGVAGVRLSCEAWPTHGEQFPHMPPFFQSLLGWGPLARTVAGCRKVIHALRPHLRAHVMPPKLDKDDVVLYAPDARTLGRWPTFYGDVARALTELGVRLERETRLVAASTANEIYNAYLCANFDQFVRSGELPLMQALSAVVLGLATNGRFDRRVHPYTGMLLAFSHVAGMTKYRDKARAGRALLKLRDAARAIWAEGRLVVAPMATVPAPKHGRAGFDWDLQAFCKLGNLVDATAAVVPFGKFEGGLPRSLQIMGPPGSEDAVLALAERLEGIGRLE
jgi:Asp-tRNA(Asn)/Glu-tRNA(Gln) amidotransferase A subunit family amidase